MIQRNQTTLTLSTLTKLALIRIPNQHIPNFVNLQGETPDIRVRYRTLTERSGRSGEVFEWVWGEFESFSLEFVLEEESDVSIGHIRTKRVESVDYGLGGSICRFIDDCFGVYKGIRYVDGLQDLHGMSVSRRFLNQKNEKQETIDRSGNNGQYTKGKRGKREKRKQMTNLSSTKDLTGTPSLRRRQRSLRR